MPHSWHIDRLQSLRAKEHLRLECRAGVSRRRTRFVQCASRFGFSHTAWIKAIRRGQVNTRATSFHDRRRRYDWTEVQAYFNEGHTYRECMSRFGYCADSWTKAARRGEIQARARALPLKLMMSRHSARASIKRRLLELGLLTEKCSRCGLMEWRGKSITIQLDHINGVKDDWRIENLRMLCPNCHSQTPTFSGRNVRRELPR